MAGDDDARRHFTAIIERATRAGSSLPAGPLRSAIEQTTAAETADLAGAASLDGWHRMRPLVLHAADAPVDQLAAWHGAIGDVTAHTPAHHRRGQWSWLTAGTSGSGARTWRGGLVDLIIKSQFLAGATDVTFDVQLPNGRDTDVRATLIDRPVHIEATVLTESDEDQGVHARALADAAGRGTTIYTRPGRFDPDDAKGPSPYYDARRVYSKIFDKLALGGDPGRSQLSDETPNIVVLSIWTDASPLLRSLGLGWALDELLVSQPNRPTNRPVNGGVDHNDPSLVAFLHATFGQSTSALLTSPRRLGAVAVLGGVRFDHARVNYNADRVNVLTHAEIAELERILSAPSALVNSPD